jgi:DNA-3-methyladenine glycosylase
MYQKLDRDFFARSTLEVAPQLVGKYIVHRLRKNLTLVARVVETEAYCENDPACHAYANCLRRAKGLSPSGRSALLFGPPGIAYVYLNYGIHWLFNVVTEQDGVAGAVLFRAVEPVEGLREMENRRAPAAGKNLTNGPGKLTVALGITSKHNGQPLTKGDLFLASSGEEKPVVLTSGPRIGISQAKEVPWRFYEQGNPYVSNT